MIKIDITEGDQVIINDLTVRWDDEIRKFVCETITQRENIEP